MQFSHSSIGMDEIPQEISTEITDALCAASRQYGVEIVAVNATFNLDRYGPGAPGAQYPKHRCHVQGKPAPGLPAADAVHREPQPRIHVARSPTTPLREAWQELACNIRPVVETARRYEMYLGVETEASNG